MLSDFPSPDVGSYLMKNHHEIQNSNNDAERSEAQGSQYNTILLQLTHILNIVLSAKTAELFLACPNDIVTGADIICK